jgi:hypothetical protein
MRHFFLSCTASFKASNRRPLASLILSSHRIRGFPCRLYPATCPSIMYRSSDPSALTLYFAGYIVLQKIFRCPRAANNFFEGYLLASPALSHANSQFIIHDLPSQSTLCSQITESGARYEIPLEVMLKIHVFCDFRLKELDRTSCESKWTDRTVGLRVINEFHIE